MYERGGHLGHVTRNMSSDFHFLVPESFHTKFGSDRHMGQGQEMTLTYNTNISSYIQLDVCSYYLSGHWLQQLLEIPLISLFPIEKPMLRNLYWP